MGNDGYTPTLGYAVSIASVALALFLTLLLRPLIQPSVFPLFFAAVTVSAWYGGLGPGIVATVLSDVSIDAFFIEPPGILNIDLDDFLRLTVFTLVTGLTSSLTARRKKAEEALRREQRQLEVRVQERTAELSQTNDALRAEILKRQQTEKSLRDSEEKFRRLAENIQEVFWLCDPDIREIYYVSPAYETIWGRSCRSLYDSPQSFLEAIHPEDRDLAVDTIREGTRKGYDLNFRIVRPDGVVRWIRDRAFPIRNGSGNVYCVAGIAEDMTEMMRSQEVLQRHAQIIDQIHDSVVSTDLDGYVTSWNKGAERLFGYSAKEALNQHISFVYPESEREFLQQQVIKPLKEKSTHEIEVRMQRKSGETFDAHLGLSRLRNSQGSAVGMIGYSMDITARKRAEEELQTRIRQQAAIAELGQRALVETDLSELMDEAVKRTAETLEVDFTKVLQLLPSENVLLLRAGVGWREGEVGRRVVGGGVESQAGYTLHTHEPVIVTDLRAEPRFSGPALLAEHGVTSGVSVIIGGRQRPFGVLGAHTIARREFTKDDVNFLQAVANLLADAIERQRLLARLTQRVKELTVLHRTARLLEREGEVGEQLQEVVAIFPSGWQYPEITGARILFDGREYRSSNFKGSPWNQREEFRAAQGTSGAVEIVYIEKRPRQDEGPFLAEERSLIASLAEMLKLYLERKEAWTRAAQFAQELEERNRELLRLQGEMGRVERLAALGRITGSIAHDLGTPLNSVLGYTQILSQAELPESAQRRLTIIKTQVERMVEIINQYLSRTRSSFQKREEVNANKLVEETLVLLSPMFHEQHVEVTTNLSASVPLIRGDLVSLQRLLINLFDNAVDAMGAGGRITVTTSPIDRSETMQGGVSIAIADTGPGIPGDLLPKIFDFFVTTKAPGKGTGMGLAVCQEIAKQHGGTIHITSKEGQGTTVGLVLPIDATASRDASVPIENHSLAR